MATKTKTGQLQIRVTPAQKRALQLGARNAGMTISAWVLASALPDSREHFQSCVTRLARGDSESFALAEINDQLTALGRDELTRTVALRPRLPRSERLKNQIAAMVELAAHRCGVSPPAWTRAIEPLKVPFFGTTLEGLRLHLLVSSPPPFRRRNLFVDASLGDRV
ncbi:MAG: hypothetical protein A2289_07685 [Deltaproteobacteria bacterium RIFOXYA12_FULL_58_15]|nr:MAG: hypothetical protein A2289_07685 [Deltaproteobacteria bacterium RIFOXYA12_FULL_58_15]